MGFEGYRHWFLFVDDYTDMPFNFFISEKSQLEEDLEHLFIDLKNTDGILVKIVRCGNAGETVNQKDAVLNSSILPPVHHNKTDA